MDNIGVKITYRPVISPDIDGVVYSRPTVCVK
jgi:hypothetical protein